MKENLKQLYIKIPILNCKGKCHAGCSGIVMSKAELDLIVERIGYDPFNEKNPDEVLNKAYTHGLKSIKCPLLTEDKKCSIYDIRPLICRLFGATRRMQCPFGCKPKKWLSEIQARKILKNAQELSEEKYK